MATKVVAESDNIKLTQYQPPPKPEAKPKPTDAELEERKQQVADAATAGDMMLETSFGIKPKAAPAAPAETPAETPAVVPEVKPKPAKKPAPKPAAPQPSADDVAERAARKVLDEIAPKGDALPEEVQELTPQDQRHFNIFKVMGESDPKYKDLADKFTAFAKSRYDYEKKWLKDNPDKEFDPAAEEHEAFFKKQPQFEDEDYDDARITIRARKIAREEIENGLKPIRERDQQEHIRREIEPKIVGAVFKGSLEFLKGVSPEIAALVTGKDGGLDYSPANLEKCDNADPIACDVLQTLIQQQYIPLMDTLERTFTPNIGFKLNPQMPAHKRIIDEIRFFEQSIGDADAPADVKLRGGKQFATFAQFQKMQDAITSGKGNAESKEAKLAELDGKYWTVGVGDIRRIISTEITENAKATIEQRKRIAAKQFGKPASGAEPPAPKPDLKPSPAPAQKPLEKPAPPASVSGGVQVASTPPAGGSGKNSSEIAMDVAFPR